MAVAHKKLREAGLRRTESERRREHERELPPDKKAMRKIVKQVGEQVDYHAKTLGIDLSKIPDDQKKILKDLTPELKKFADEYISCGVARQAAIRAGVRPSNASGRGTRWLNTPSVVIYLHHRRLKLLMEVNLCADDVVAGLLHEARGEGQDTNSKSRITAWIALGKYFNIFESDKKNQDLAITQLGALMGEESEE